jgi:hypothetical protein
LIASPLPGVPANLTAFGTNLLIRLNWSASSGAAGYNLKRSTTNGGTYLIIVTESATNYSDTAVNSGTTYYYVVSATNSTAESADSAQVSAAPLPSNQPTNIVVQAVGGGLQISWSQDHLGWRLQAQSNALNAGLGINWVDVSDSGATNRIFLAINPANGSVFLRLIYP